MGFENSCFISYSNGQKEIIQGFIAQLQEALEAVLETYFKDYPVYLDTTRLQGGDFYNQHIASALCRSVCMIAVLTPTYCRQSYCLREYVAMEELEKERFNKINKSQNLQHGLIIPIILRGLKYVPDIIKEERAYYDFSKFQLGNVKIIKNSNFRGQIEEIAERIYDFFLEFEELADSICTECGTFKLPSKDKVPELLELFKTQKPKPPFR
jgi:hypothetical protein